jgi:hypothetical protein
MTISYRLEIATPLPLVQVARELVEVARLWGLFDPSVSPERVREDGAVTNLETWVRVYDATPESWYSIVTDLGITPTVGIGFQLHKHDKIFEQQDDLVRLASGVLDRIPGDALLSGMEQIWLMRRDGDLSVNESDEIWPPHRLAALRQPYHRATHTFAEE